MPQTGPRFLTEEDLTVLTTTQQTALGALGQGRDDSLYRYVKFGGTSTINGGLLLTAVALAANSTALSVAAANAIGDTSVQVTNGATAVTQDEFAGGYLEVIKTGLVRNYLIRGNTLATASTGTITVYLAEPLTSALTTSDTVNLSKSIYDSPAASTTQALPVGVTLVQVANTSSVTNYGWVQTHGVAFVLATSGTKGYPVAQDVATNAGYVANIGAGAAETVPQIGVFKESYASGSTSAPVFLQID